MKKDFLISWKSSSQPRKQRKYIENAPLHVKGKFLNAHLSVDLRKKYGKRSFRLKKGDKVKIMSGQFAKKTAKVVSVDLKNSRVRLENIELIKKDGSKVQYPLHASKLMIIEFNTDDKARMKRLEAKK